MNDYPDVFCLLSHLTRKTGVTFILAGGFAVNYYGVSRQTADLDFLITKSDFEKILSLLEKEGYVQEYTEEAFARLTSKGPYLVDLDFIFVDEATLEKIFKEASSVSITGENFLIPSLNHLIALKLHALKYNSKFRLYKDLPDIIDLIRANGIDVKSNTFKDLCLKYGPADIYELILKSI